MAPEPFRTLDLLDRSFSFVAYTTFHFSRLEFYVIMYLLDHHNNDLTVFFYTCGRTQLNMNGRMREQECIKCLTSKMACVYQRFAFHRQ